MTFKAPVPPGYKTIFANLNNQIHGRAALTSFRFFLPIMF